MNCEVLKCIREGLLSEQHNCELLPRKKLREKYIKRTQMVRGNKFVFSFEVEENTRLAFLGKLDLATRTHHPLNEKSDGIVIGFSVLHNILSKTVVDLEELKKYLWNIKIDRFEPRKEIDNSLVQYDIYITNVVTHETIQNKSCKYDGHLSFLEKKNYIITFFDQMESQSNISLEDIIAYLMRPVIINTETSDTKKLVKEKIIQTRISARKYANKY